MQDYKIVIPSDIISRQVQEKAFTLGYKWASDDNIIRYTERRWLVIGNAWGIYAPDESVFNNAPGTLISYQDFLAIGEEINLNNNNMPDQNEIELKLIKQPRRAKNLTVGNTYKGIFVNSDDNQVDSYDDAEYFLCTNNNDKEARYAIELFDKQDLPAPVITYAEVIGSLEVQENCVTSDIINEDIVNLGWENLNQCNSPISCGIDEIDCLEDLYADLQGQIAASEFPFAFDRETFVKDLFKAIVEKAIDECSAAFVLLSTKTSSRNICNYVDEITESRGGVSRNRVNPNSHNEICLWVIDK